MFSLTYARGNARKFLGHWRNLVVLSFIVPVALAVISRHNFFSAPQPGVQSQPNLLLLRWPAIALFVAVLICAVLVLMNLERTYRASIGTMRWRIKFMLLGVALLFVVRMYTSSQVLLYRGIDLPFDELNSGALLLASILLVKSFIRAGHFETDVYPSESILQGSLTVLLAGIYLLVVGVFAKVVTYIGGSDAFAGETFGVLAALVSLAILLQSDRFRLFVRRFISRNFQRPHYDYRTVWQRFNQGTASQVKEEDLCQVLVHLVADAFQSLSVSLWLLNDRKDGCARIASTSHIDGPSSLLEIGSAEAESIQQFFGSKPSPLEIETSPDLWAQALKRVHPSLFSNGGRRVCAPIFGRGELLGFFILGDRVAGVPFSLQDYDLLACATDHAAASLLNVFLSQKLLLTKELEAFQTMAAFFVHDLKNAASSLNLMLQNLPVHFDDPAFREDALRGTAKSVDHINRLIGRLGQLRHEPNVSPSVIDLNQLVEEVVTQLNFESDFRLIKNLSTLQPVSVDREQIAKVLTNLVLNAKEATGEDGEVRIASQQDTGWILLTIADTGCGMSPDFLHSHLFRPFQTTKKNGLGIGMFQSKMIVEAHGGRIAVSSQQGRGTTFRVYLPTSNSLT